MLVRKRIILHTGFWLLYFSVILFNDLYLSTSFLSDPSLTWFLKVVVSQLLILTLKITAVYYVLYSLIPRWLKSGKKIKLTIESLMITVALLVAYRCMIHFIIWPFIYENPGKIHVLSMVARLFYSLLDILQVVGIAATIKLFRLRIAAVKNEKKLVQEKLNSEIKHLKAQINPHFLFNSLNSIFSLSRLQSPKTPDMILKLSNLLRYMLYESEKNFTTIEDELKTINDYIELQLMRFGEKVQVKKNIQIENPMSQITPLLILPLVENAFKHGIVGPNEISLIHFKLNVEKEIFFLEIKNTVSKESINVDSYEGIGLTNIKRQLQLLYREYEFNYEEKGNYFTVHLEIKLNTYAGFELFDSRG